MSPKIPLPIDVLVPYQFTFKMAIEAGDWNRDGVFDLLDILVAAQTGNYLQGP